MVLRGAQIHRRGQVKCSLFSTQSLPHDLARLYGRMLPLTPADLGGAADPCLDALTSLTQEKPEQSSDEQGHQEAALKQDVDRPTASSRSPQKHSCIMCEKTCCHTYVFRIPDGGPYGL